MILLLYVSAQSSLFLFVPKKYGFLIMFEKYVIKVYIMSSTPTPLLYSDKCHCFFIGWGCISTCTRPMLYTNKHGLLIDQNKCHSSRPMLCCVLILFCSDFERILSASCIIYMSRSTRGFSWALRCRQGVGELKLQTHPLVNEFCMSQVALGVVA